MGQVGRVRQVGRVGQVRQVGQVYAKGVAKCVYKQLDKPTDVEETLEKLAKDMNKGIFSDYNMNYKYTDISEAVQENNISQLEIIYTDFPNLFFEDYNGDFLSAIHYIAAYGNEQMLEWLYTKIKFNIDYSNGKGTALGIACSYGNIDTVQWFLSHKAKIDGQHLDILSPLLEAVIGGHTKIVKLLIEYKANVNRMHLRSGLLPLDYAKSRGFTEIARLLKDKGAKALSQLPDWVDNPIEGVGILTYITVQLGKIFPLDIENSGNVAIKMVQGSKIKRRVLFTFGLYALQQPMIELCLVLPEYWNFYNTQGTNLFPVHFLKEAIALIQSGASIKEGDYLLLDTPPFNTLTAPEGLAGFYVSDVTWNKTQEEEEDEEPEEDTDDEVTILSLIPIKKTKKGFTPLDKEKARNAGWAKLTLNV